MLETQITSHQTQDPMLEKNTKQRKILRMVENDRMGGTVPRWEYAKSETEKIQHRLENAQYGNESFANTLAYASGQVRPHQEEFGFGDLIDMVNPLQHIPLVGHVYREVTGDDIQPISQIMGGTLYGGIGGAVSGMANTIIEHETGKNLTQNVLEIADDTLNSGNQSNSVEKAIEVASLEPAAGKAAIEEAMPGNLLSFVDLKDNGISIERISDTPKPTYPNLDKAPLWPREPITEVKLSGLYALSQ